VKYFQIFKTKVLFSALLRLSVYRQFRTLFSIIISPYPTCLHKSSKNIQELQKCLLPGSFVFSMWTFLSRAYHRRPTSDKKYSRIV